MHIILASHVLSIGVEVDVATWVQGCVYRGSL